jgi:hypothetical protein
VGRTNSPEPVDLGALELATVVSMSAEEWEAHKAFYRITVQQRDRAWATIEGLAGNMHEGELARLYAIESAALAVVGSMTRRSGKVHAPTLATFDTLKALDAAIGEQPEEDHGGHGG